MDRDNNIHEIRELKKMLKNNTDRLGTLPGGRVSIKKERNSHALRLRNGGAGLAFEDKYVSLNAPEASDLATKIYLEKTNRILKKRLKALEKFEKDYDYDDPAEVIEKLPYGVRRLVRKPLLPMEQKARAWMNSMFDSNPVPFDLRQNYITAKHERVRSRAEVIIANTLIMLEIPYRYEAAFCMDNRIVYPDFSIMNPETGELFYLEYFGKMNDPDYAARQFMKIQEYSKTDRAENFIYIFEYGTDVSMDTKAIENLILRTIFRGQPKSLKRYEAKLSGTYFQNESR